MAKDLQFRVAKRQEIYVTFRNPYKADFSVDYNCKIFVEPLVLYEDRIFPTIKVYPNGEFEIWYEP